MQKYVPLEGSRSNVAQTAWAMMGLMYAGQVSYQSSSLGHFCQRSLKVFPPILNVGLFNVGLFERFSLILNVKP